MFDAEGTSEAVSRRRKGNYGACYHTQSGGTRLQSLYVSWGAGGRLKGSVASWRALLLLDRAAFVRLTLWPTNTYLIQTTLCQLSRLDNGLRAVVIQDREVAFAAACASVQVRIPLSGLPRKWDGDRHAYA